MKIEVDYVQLSRVIQNYYSNALKYAFGKVTMNTSSEGESLLISVRDYGDSIPQEYRQRIFAPFFQIPGKEKKDSTGLVLDFARELVKLHRGETWAESEGSCFYLEIPLYVYAPFTSLFSRNI